MFCRVKSDKRARRQLLHGDGVRFTAYDTTLAAVPAPTPPYCRWQHVYGLRWSDIAAVCSVSRPRGARRIESTFCRSSKRSFCRGGRWGWRRKPHARRVRAAEPCGDTLARVVDSFWVLNHRARKWSATDWGRFRYALLWWHERNKHTTYTHYAGFCKYCLFDTYGRNL